MASEGRRWMIDLSRTRSALLAEIEAPHRAADLLTDLTDPRILASDVHLLVREHSPDDLFPPLEVVLSARFAGVPRPELIRDLLTPLRNAIGNAYKHGNKRDRTKSISVQIRLTPKGVLLAVTDEGEGFDVAQTLRLYRENENYFMGHGAGFRNFERATSPVSFENGGRTLLLSFRPTMAGSEAATAFSLGPARKVLDAGWVRSCLSAELREFGQDFARIEACQVYPTPARTGEDCGVRCVLRVVGPDASQARTKILTGRLHGDAAAAKADFESATKLHDVMGSARLRVPRPAARLTTEPRLVLYDFHPWMNLWEFLLDRGSPGALRRRGERIGQGLAQLHRSRIALEEAEPDLLGERFRAIVERTAANLQALDLTADLVNRFRWVAERIQEQATSDLPRDLAPIHGALGWDCIHYGVDGHTYLYRFEACRLSHPGLDLGGFLADLLLFTTNHGTEEAYRLCRDAFLESYYSISSRPLGNQDLNLCVAFALIDRLDRSFRSSSQGSAIAAGFLLSQCERILSGEEGKDGK